MYFYIKGKVVEQYGSFIVLDNNNIGYLINVANPYSFELNKEYEVYIYQHIKEDENSGVKWIDIGKVIETSTEKVMKPIYQKLNEKLMGMKIE